MERLDPFIPVRFDIFSQETAGHNLIQWVTGYFASGGRKAYVIDTNQIGNGYWVEIQNAPPPKENVLRTVIKIVSYITLIIPLLMALSLAAITLFCPFYLPFKEQPQVDLLLDKVAQLQKVTTPEQATDEQKAILEEAYSHCLRAQERCSQRNVPHKRLALRFGEIIQQYTLLEPSHKNRLWYSLESFLYAIEMRKNCPDFTAFSLLKDLDLASLDEVEKRWAREDMTLCYQKAREHLTVERCLSLCKTMRLLCQNYRASIIQGGEPSPREKVLLKNWIGLAENLLRAYPQSASEREIADSQHEAVQQELWKLRRDEFPFYLEKVLGQTKKLNENRKWLADNASSVPEVVFVAQQAQTVDEGRAALESGIEKLALKSATAATLKDVLEGKQSTSEAIASVAQEIQNSSNTVLFPLIPALLADKLMRPYPHQIDEAEPLLNVAMAMVDSSEKRGATRTEFDTIKTIYRHLQYFKVKHLFVHVVGDLNAVHIERKSGKGSPDTFTERLTQIIKQTKEAEHILETYHYNNLIPLANAYQSIAESMLLCVSTSTPFPPQDMTLLSVQS